MKAFHYSEFFDLVSFKELFEQTVHVWEAIGLLEAYVKSRDLGRIEGEVSENAFLVDPETISIGKGTVVEPGAYIKGPCVIGEYCTVRHGAYIRGNVLVDDHCVIGHDTEVKNSLFLEGAQAGHFAYVGDSLLGKKTNLGAGTKLANLRLDRENIIIRHQDGQIETGLRKFGAIIGDQAQIGCNVVTNPGTLLGKGVQCYACLNVGGFIPANHVVKNSVKPITKPLLVS